MKRVCSLIGVVLLAGIQCGCAEKSQEAAYENGRYAGKPDTPAWQGEAFGGSRDNWEREIKQRNRLQSEYTRPGGA